MPELINFGLTTAYVKSQFQQLVESQGSLAKAIIALLNKDKYLEKKYRFRSLASCEVWQEQVLPGADSLSYLSTVMHMLDTYVKFNRLESRAAAIEELLQATAPEGEKCQENNTEHDSIEMRKYWEENWNVLQHQTIDRYPIARMQDAHAQTETTGSSKTPPIVISVSTQTLKKKPKPLSCSIFCQTDICTAKETGSQTDLIPMVIADASLPSFVITEEILKNETAAKNSIRLDPMKHISPVVERLISPQRSRKKNSAFSSEPIVAKRPRKALLTKETKGCSSVTASICSFTTSSSLPMAVNNQVFSGAPVFNSIAPSRQPPISNCTSAIPTLPGNVYIYRGQHGIPISVPKAHQQQLTRKLVLNPRVVISPLPVLNSPEVGPRQNLMRKSFDGSGSTYPPQMNCSSNSGIVYSSNVNSAPDQPPKKAISNITSINVFAPIQRLSGSSVLGCKHEYDEDGPYPAPKAYRHFRNSL